MIDLCKLLIGFEGETFYSPSFGDVTLLEVRDNPMPIVIDTPDDVWYLTGDGKLYRDGECMLFPSKTQRDWNKWAKEQLRNRLPKTWDEFIATTEDTPEENYGIVNVTWADEKDYSQTNYDSPIEKAALALLKVHKLIEVGYGGNVGGNENPLTYYTAGITSTLIIKTPEQYEHPSDIGSLKPFLFKHKDSAKEFLSHPENVQLVKDFYMI